jgi:pyruvate/2-oxoglutarate/acetoin dehydrogenase E1 component
LALPAHAPARPASYSDVHRNPTLLRSVRKTGRVIVVHEANGLCGVGAEVGDF